MGEWPVPNGGILFLGLQKGLRRPIFLTLGVILVPKTPEHDQMCDPKCSKVDLYGKRPVPNWGIYFRPLLVLACVPEFFTPTRTVP